MKNQEVIYSNSYEQRTAIINGNGTESYYTYEPVMRRMTNLKTINPNGDLLNNDYTYDYVGNILSIDNVGQNPYHQEYNYDDSYQLSTATGNWFNNNQVTYNLGMSYSPSGRITNKTLYGNKIDNNGTSTLDHKTDYNYTGSNPYGVSDTYDNINGIQNNFDWDIKGNMILHNSPQWGNRQLCWTEDNRLQAVKDDKMGVYYNYDATGERNLKLTGGTIDLTQNGTTINIPILDQQTLYASALVTVNDKGYTKHYFEEGKRICSKIGSGELQDIWTLSTPIEDDYQKIHDNRSIGGVIKIFDICMKLPVEIKNKDLFKEIILPYESQVNSSEPVFYYHSDHLGSASYITDDSGIETQQLVYLPFGEDWVDMKYNTGQYETPYKFNGKEKDEETGYNNYGARYYYDWASIWLSVDPMSDKYPHVTNYIYCSNNPVMVVDPDGRDEYGLDVNTGRLSYLNQKEGKDVIHQGTFGKNNTFVRNGKESLDNISKDILTSTNRNEDLSKTGILVKGGRQGEGLDIMKFISFNSNKEMTAAGFRDNQGKDGLAIDPWSMNTHDRGVLGKYNQSNGLKNIGQRTFFIHTHPGDKKGNGGYWTPSSSDINIWSNKSNPFLMVPKYILSKRGGLTEYNLINNKVTYPITNNENLKKHIKRQ
ncbi:hypothetical protein SDC9_45296 [bioreactor metagenome]|uniref:Uncharacterized protein n=1 Tax=bioreactor metagenome TaxID=1076179 RepID=A0A644W5T4_9ZZZZ